MDDLDQQLARRGLVLRDGTLEGNGVRVHVDRATLHERAKTSADFIDRLVERARGVPDWWVARSGVRLTLAPADADFKGALHLPLTERLAVVLCYADPDELLITWLTQDIVDKWSMPLQEVHDQALANLDAMLAETPLTVEDARGTPLGVLESPSGFKASLLLAPSLKQHVRPLGWPVLAVAPCRDFVFLFAEQHQDALVPMLAAPTVHEYENSPFPLSPELLRIADEGIVALGAYGEEPREPEPHPQ